MYYKIKFLLSLSPSHRVLPPVVSGREKSSAGGRRGIQHDAARNNRVEPPGSQSYGAVVNPQYAERLVPRYPNSPDRSIVGRG